MDYAGRTRDLDRRFTSTHDCDMHERRATRGSIRPLTAPSQMAADSSGPTGGTLGGTIALDTEFPQYMYVDYVRVYQRG